MKTIKTILLLSISILMLQCGKPIDITDQYNLDKNNGRIPKFVIEARICNQIDSNYVKITRTVNLKSDQISGVENAIVNISDNRGNSEQLTYVGNGRYQCLTLAGINDGRVYTMNAVVDGKTYSATAVIPATPLPIDSVTYIEDEANEGRYSTLIFANVHTDFEEYYMFQTFENEKLANRSDQVLVADNSQLNGRINGIELANNIKKGTLFRYKFFVISKDAFKFYTDINAQLNNDGGLFTTPPANAKGNIADAGGVFQGAYFLTDTLTIK